MPLMYALLEMLFGPTPKEGTFSDCQDWTEVYHRLRVSADGPIVPKVLASAVCGWALVQYVAHTATGQDASYGSEFFISFLLPWKWQWVAFGLCVAYRTYGGLLPMVQVFS